MQSKVMRRFEKLEKRVEALEIRNGNLEALLTEALEEEVDNAVTDVHVVDAPTEGGEDPAEEDSDDSPPEES